MGDFATVIACDESGSEGENLTQPIHRVFTHASIDLSVSEAAAVLAEAKRLAPSKVSEYKSEHLIRRGDHAVSWLLSTDGPLVGRAMVHLVDKDFFVVGKVIDLLVEEVAYAAGEDLYAGGRARQVAWTLFRQGPRALGPRWPAVIDSFNSLMRGRQKKGTKATVDEFFAIIDDVRLRSTRRDVEDILARLWRAKPHANEFQARLIEDPDQAPALDPLFSAITAAAVYWASRSPKPLRIVHDQQTSLTPGRIANLIYALAHPHPDFVRFVSAVNVVSIDLVDSKEDLRIQVADLLAGVARRVAAATLAGESCHRPELLRPFVDENSVWSDDRSWQLLTGRAGIGQ